MKGSGVNNPYEKKLVKSAKSEYERKELVRKKVAQKKWQRITLLIVLGYEAAGALSGGSLLVLAPNGRLMDMPVEIMHGFFKDFFLPGLMLIGLGILNTVAFMTVLIKTHTDWIWSGLALGGLAIWFIVEILILRVVHWLHIMWGLPVLLGILMTIPLVSSKFRSIPFMDSGADRQRDGNKESGRA